MSEDRDPVITKALRNLPVPDHGPDFWERLEAQLDPGPSMPSSDANADADADPALDELPTIVALSERTPRPRQLLRIVAVAATVIALLGLAVTVSSDDGDDQRLRTADAPEALRPSISTSPPARVAVGTADAAVLRWLEAIGSGATNIARDLTGPRSVAYIEALGADLDGFLLEAGEGYGGWTDVTDRSTTEIELVTVGDTGEAITIVVVSGTWTGEGEDGYKTQAIPVTQTDGGSWMVEPFAFDPEAGGRLDIVSPRPSGEGGFNGLAGDAILEARAPGNGTFHFSLDDEPATAVPGAGTKGKSGVGASFDPPGDLRSGTHLFVIAYVDGATITAFAGTFAVES